MMEYDSPRVQRVVTPSPLRATPTRSKRELRDLYSSNPPRFLLDAFEDVSDTSVPSDLPRHFLPDFAFRVVDGRSDPTSAQLSEIASHFPGCTGAAYGPPYLVISWPREQVKPWPLTVGGMPLYYATPNCPHPPTYAKGGRSAAMMRGAAERLRPWQSPSNSLIEEIARALVGKGIGLKLFGWCGVRWYAEVFSLADGRKMPSSICGLAAVWKVFSYFGESAWRSIMPSEHVIDDTSYKPTLRPGIHLGSTVGAGTTSGVPVKGPDGERFVTVALHGFKQPGGEEVHHPWCMKGDTLIGHVQHDISFPGLDVGLVELEDGVTYSTVSFDGEEENGTDLEGLVPSENVGIGEILSMDSAYNGRCEGMLTWRGVNVIDPIDPQNIETVYVHVLMMYFGNGISDVKPGSCGSAIWNEANEVVAFFRWYDSESAIAYAPSVDGLIDAGYVLEAIP